MHVGASDNVDKAKGMWMECIPASEMVEVVTSESRDGKMKERKKEKRAGKPGSNEAVSTWSTKTDRSDDR